MAGVALVGAAALGAGRLALLADRRGPDLRPPHPGLRPRPAPVAGLLHPHPDRCPGLPPQQRRDRRPARVHLHPVQHRLQLGLGRGRRHRDVRPELAGHPAVPAAVPVPAAGLAAGVSARLADADPGADGRQRRHGQRDDRAVQRRRRDAAQAVRPPRRRRTRSSPPRPRRVRDLGVRIAPGQPDLHGRDAAGAGAGHRRRLRRRRPPRRRRHAHRRHPDRARHAAGAAARPAAEPVQRPDRRDDRAGQLRAGLRGARPALARSRRSPTRSPLPPRRVRRWSSTTSAFTYPRADEISLASLETVARTESRDTGAGAPRHQLPGRARPDGRAGRPVRAPARRR